MLNSLLWNLPAKQQYLLEKSVEAVYECSDTLGKWKFIIYYGDDYIASRRRVENLLFLPNELQEEFLPAIQQQGQMDFIGDKPTLSTMHLDK